MQKLIFSAMLIASAFVFAGPAMADGKSGGGLQVTPPPPLNTQAPAIQPQYTHTAHPAHGCHDHCHDPCAQNTPAERLDALTLDAATIGTLTGGVGTGVHDSFIGGGRFFGAGNGAVSSNGRAFGTRARGGFVVRNIAISRAAAGQ